MPAENTDLPLDWTEENLAKVIKEIYAKAATDKEYHDRLMAEPLAVLSSLIKVPDDIGDRVFAREKSKKMLLLNVPAYGDTRETDPAVSRLADYEVICTIIPW